MNTNICLPITAFELKGYNGNFIKLTITEVSDFPKEIVYGGGYQACGDLDICIESYSVHTTHHFTTGELYILYTELSKCYEKVKGEAKLDNIEKAFFMTLIFEKDGKISVSGVLQTKPHEGNKLYFEMFTDQTFISQVINDLEKINSIFGNLNGVNIISKENNSLT